MLPKLPTLGNKEWRVHRLRIGTLFIPIKSALHDSKAMTVDFYSSCQRPSLYLIIKTYHVERYSHVHLYLERFVAQYIRDHRCPAQFVAQCIHDHQYLGRFAARCSRVRQFLERRPFRCCLVVWRPEQVSENLNIFKESSLEFAQLGVIEGNIRDWGRLRFYVGRGVIFIGGTVN